MLSDRNIFCSLGGGEKRRGPMPIRDFHTGKSLVLVKRLVGTKFDGKIQ